VSTDVVDGLVADARMWRAAAKERAPSYHRLLEAPEDLLTGEAERGRAAPIAQRLEAVWADRSFSVFYERPLLLIAALRYDALARGEAHPLWAALRDRDPDAGVVTRDAVAESLAPDVVWQVMRDRYVQTNETSRAVAWLWPTHLAGCNDGARPLGLLELGCAAGLNLVGDAMSAPWTEPSGTALSVVTSPDVVLRLGIDRHPVVLDDDAQRFLRACIWAGETKRLSRFDEAVEALRRASPPPELAEGNLREPQAPLERLAAAVPGGGLAVAIQTIVRDYLDGPTSAAYEDAMRTWLASRPKGSAVWLELEIAPAGEDDLPAAIRAHLVLARTGYHPSVVRPDPDAVATFVELTAP